MQNVSSGSRPSKTLTKVLAESEAVDEKVQHASEKLAVVNQALEERVRDRGDPEEELAASPQQGAADRHACLHDPLTGLPNRALFNDRLDHGMAQARRHGWSLAVMFLDLDGLKAVNDTYGHEAGERVLLQVSARLKENTRSDDTVFRHGDDEFLCLLMGVGHARDIAMVAEKLLKVIEAPCDIGRHDPRASPSIGASIGIAIYPKDGADAATLVKSADLAMYEAKRSFARYSFAKQRASQQQAPQKAMTEADFTLNFSPAFKVPEPLTS